MTIRKYSAKIIPALCCDRKRLAPAALFAALVAVSVTVASPPAEQAAKSAVKHTGARVPATRIPSKAGDLASLVHDWRDNPTPAHRAFVESYAVAHAKENTGALARFALAMGEVEQKNFAAAITEFKGLPARLPQISDYAAYYSSLARVESSDFTGIGKGLAPTHNVEIRSPLAGRAWVLEARALETSDAAAAVRLLREHYNDLPQPDGDITMAESYQAAQDLPHAVDFYQRVYYQWVNSEPASRAGIALSALKDSMGASFPQPLPEQLLRRADRLVEIRDYSHARSEYQALTDQLKGAPRDLARVGVGVADFLGGKVAPACSYLRGLDLPESEADAEREYYLEECGRKESDETAAMTSVYRLGKQYPRSSWRLKAIMSASNRFLVTNRPDDYLPLYKIIYEEFPKDPQAAICHWRTAFQAYLHGKPDALALIREHLRNYPGHGTSGAALYFLGRQYEQTGDAGSARACYQRLSQIYQSQYYGMQARERLAHPEVTAASANAETAKFLADLKLDDPKPLSSAASRATTLRIERSRLLRSAGLNDFADAELRFGARTDGQSALLGMEMADAADHPHQAMRIMKSMGGDYLSLTIDQAPRKFWELLFPLPFKSDVMQEARSKELDPFLLAGLIRQESEFNPQALSPANAYGLTQVRPATGRQYARRVGIQRFSNSLLFQPTTNLKIGSLILRSMLDQNSGKVEQTLAGYNAGPARAAEWLTWNTYREPAEFVEAIPFTETREYVQAVLRNAEIYRTLYR